MTITEFLLARIAEDEEPAQYALDLLERYPVGEVTWKWAHAWGSGSYAFDEGAPSPSRVLAECQAKRRIIELHYSWGLQAKSEPNPPFGPILKTQVTTAETILRTLASVYADHPDFDPIWAV